MIGCEAIVVYHDLNQHNVLLAQARPTMMKHLPSILCAYHYVSINVMPHYPQCGAGWVWVGDSSDNVCPGMGNLNYTCVL